jgi:SWI/SNF-related matrix-associated actin-dependent regulator of chromatin subfamily A3
MGLGKTIAVVSLIGNTLDSARIFAYGPLPKITLKVAKTAPEPPLTAAHFAMSVWGMPDASTSNPEKENGTPTGKKGKGKREEHRALEESARAARLKAKSRATLIVCPLSTIANWEDQFKEHWAGEVTVVGGASGVPPAGGAQTMLDDSSWNGTKKRGAKIRVYVYHGAARRPDPAFLADFDAVITTYSTLATEFSKQTKTSISYEDEEDEEQLSSSDGDISEVDENGNSLSRGKDKKKPKKRPPGAALAAGQEATSPLQMVHWFRVVLDEAQYVLVFFDVEYIVYLLSYSSIKETSTIASRACCDLAADRRLCLTGTPVQNKLDDVYALIKFLRLDPFDDKSVWTEYIGGPAKFGQPLGVARLQTIMKSVTLRRTKETKDSGGKAILDLPPRRDELRFLKFDEKEKTVYDSYYDDSKAEFNKLRKNGEVMKNYVGILQKILRLRQICDHWELVEGKDEIIYNQDSAMNYDEISAAIGREGINVSRATAVFALLRESGTAQCVECNMDLATPVAGAPDMEEFDSAPKPRKKNNKSRTGTRQSSPSGIRPVLTRCQHLFCIECFRLSICPNWPKVSSDVHRSCSVCSTGIVPAIDAVEVNPDGSTALDPANKPRPPKKEKRQKGSSMNGFNASTKVQALLGDLLPFSRSNPYSSNYDPHSIDVQLVDEQGNEVEDGYVKTVVL